MSAWKAGKVQWFDDSSGEGMIVDEKTGQTFYVHYSTIVSEETHKKLLKGKKVKYQLYENLYSKRVDKVREC